jgi:hypothetical protein
MFIDFGRAPRIQWVGPLAFSVGALVGRAYPPDACRAGLLMLGGAQDPWRLRSQCAPSRLPFTGHVSPNEGLTSLQQSAVIHMFLIIIIIFMSIDFGWGPLHSVGAAPGI